MTFTGTARQENGDTLYTETHSVSGTCGTGTFRPEVQKIAYQLREESASFARKILRYERSLLRPTVEFQQPDYSETLDIHYPDNDRLQISWTMAAGSNKETRRYDLAYANDVVVDAGFDHLVRDNWKRVQEGRTVEFEFLAPTRGETFGFVMEPAMDSGISADHVVKIRPRGLVLRFLVDPIILGYNQQGFLTDYVGLTNIRKSRNENYTAHIRYTLDQAPACNLTH
ncbi:hypothetical protein FWJ25_07330 [Marinobacter salinexigens]|uniref:Uncharacterized protein n=2 Tax=Marinobacter salinexigens TaxID=2919747 RepID=A0A5B0VLL6_9GAMM|nr:hypothetical protein FWJ25_07330 [Marinobacter salinexigens]